MKPSSILIAADRSLWSELSALGRNPSLVFELARVDTLARIQQTLLGRLWYVLQPGLMTALCVAVFSEMTQVTTLRVSPTLFYLSGLILWTYFSSVLSAVAFCLNTHSALLKRIYFPRFALPLSIAAAKLFPLALQFFLFASVLALDQGPERLGAGFLALPAILAQTSALALGCGLWLAGLSVRYRDAHHALGYLIQLGMFASPVLYPSQQLPERWRWVFEFNPLAGCLETLRAAFLAYPAQPSPYGLPTIVVILLSGAYVFHRAQRHCVDSL